MSSIARTRPGFHSLAPVVVLLLGSLLAACDSSPHEAPASPTAEAGDGEVQLTWTAVPGVGKYVIRWSDDGGPPTNKISDVQGTSYLHTGLTNLRTYRYQIFAIDGGEGPGSVIVSAEPGPIPAAVEWVAVRVVGDDHVLHFAPAAGADSYRIYIGSVEAQLAGRRPSAAFVTATTSPFTRTAAGASIGNYYKVMAMSSTRTALEGPVAVTPVFGIGNFDLPAVSAAVADTDEDGCLELVGTTGDCLGGLAARDLAVAGLDGLFATGRANGDSRLADFNADGIPDVFTSVLSPADDAASRAILHLNQGDGVFQEDAAVAALGIGGQGGTVLAADFDNDGDVDLFVPHDWSGADGGRNWLLANDGAGVFSDVTAAAGLLTGPAGAAYVPAGGQAVDFNEDGRVDILFGSRLMTNNGDGTFTDAGPAAGVPLRADQGLRLFDADMDGDLDLLHHDGELTRLHRNVQGVFDAGTVLATDAVDSYGSGLQVCDINADGFEDILVANNAVATDTGVPRLLVNIAGEEFLRSRVPQEVVAGSNDLLAFNDLLTCVDLNDNGTPDVIARWDSYRVLRSALPLERSLRLRVLGTGGDRNQQGRIVKIAPAAVPGRVMTRVIESGSGLRSQGDYDLLVGAQWAGDYEISVRFKDGWVTTTASQGDSLTIYEDGRVVDALE